MEEGVRERSSVVSIDTGVDTDLTTFTRGNGCVVSDTVLVSENTRFLILPNDDFGISTVTVRSFDLMSMSISDLALWRFGRLPRDFSLSLSMFNVFSLFAASMLTALAVSAENLSE